MSQFWKIARDLVQSKALKYDRYVKLVILLILLTNAMAAFDKDIKTMKWAPRKWNPTGAF